jgi:hypothetical protein
MAIKFLQNLDLGKNAVTGLVVENGTLPNVANGVTGQLFISNNEIYFHNSSEWEQISGQSFQLSGATSSALGGIKLYTDKGSEDLSSSLQSQSMPTISGGDSQKLYQVFLDQNDKAFVNVPWVNTQIPKGTLKIEVDGTSVITDIIDGTLDFKGGTGVDVSHANTGDLTFSIDLTELSEETTVVGNDMLAGVFSASGSATQGKTKISSIKLDKLGAPAADVAFNGKKLTGVGQGSADTDGVNKLQMETAIGNAITSGMDFKGGFDASEDITQIITTAEVGDTYAVTVAGNGGGFNPVLEVGDLIICQEKYGDGSADVSKWLAVQTNIQLADASSTVKGIASFNATDFTVTSGDVQLAAISGLGDSTSKGSASKSASVTVNHNGIVTSLTDQDINITATQVSDFFTAQCASVAGTVANTSGTVITFPHSLNTLDLVVQLYEKIGQVWHLVFAEIQIPNADQVTATFAKDVSDPTIYKVVLQKVA